MNHEDLNRAKALLAQGTYTCVACHGEQLRTATDRGVKPLVQWLDAGAELSGFCAADRVVGKATAFLYCLLNVKAVYARVISTPAIEVLRQHGIEVQWEREVPGIINRAGDGPCPFEAAVWQIGEPTQALEAIRCKQQQMRARE